MKRTILIYAVLLVSFGLIISLTLEFGRRSLQPNPADSARATAGTIGSSSAVAFPSPPSGPTQRPLQNLVASGAPGGPAHLWSVLRENIQTPLSRLLLQFIVIMVATRTVGSIFRRFGQPAVIGEITAGILLGPSLLGWLWPGGLGFIFPPQSLGNLQLLSQIGVCLFMFVVGMELDVSQLRHKAQVALVVSHVSIIFPYFLGVVMALSLYKSYAGEGISFVAFALFMGIALSITAFPVLVRLLEERGMAKSFLGVTAIACAAVDDASAWAILACVVAVARATGLPATIFSLLCVLLFVALLLWVVRPRLSGWLGVERLNGRSPDTRVIAVALIFMTASALATETIGIHALFGAFLAGVVMPRKKEFRYFVLVRLDNLSRLFLLPLFFAFSGLRTHVGLLNNATSWLVCLVIIAVATLGKLGGATVSARLMDLKWSDAFALGALMNTRGLVELVALNIGYDLGILSPNIFTMMVLMALTTTFLTGPLLSLAEHVKHRTASSVQVQSASIV